MRKRAGLKAGQTAKGTKSEPMIQNYRAEKLPVTSSAQMNKAHFWKINTKPRLTNDANTRNEPSSPTRKTADNLS